MAAGARVMALSCEIATWRTSCASRSSSCGDGSGRSLAAAIATAAASRLASSSSSLSVTCATQRTGGARCAGDAVRDVRQGRGAGECCCCRCAPARSALRGFATSLGRANAGGLCARNGRASPPPNRRKRTPSVVCMAIRAVESFDASFELIPESKEILFTLLKSDIFCNQVALQPGVVPNSVFQFTEMLFQPVPWSANTKHGMPQEFEKYYHDKENYTIVNVPPNYMFQAKIFKPSRLCAIFQRVGSKPEEDMAAAETAAAQGQ